MQASMEWAGIARTFGLFTVTAVAELLGCYLPMLWLSNKGSAWLLLPAGLSLLVFVWLLTLHPAASGRVYATYGAIYMPPRWPGCGWWTASRRPGPILPAWAWRWLAPP